MKKYIFSKDTTMHLLLPMFQEEFHGRIKTFTGGVPREAKFPKIPYKIMVSIGMKRVGKTYFFFQTIHKLLKEIPITRMLYLNFEDDCLRSLTQETLRDLIDGFYILWGAVQSLDDLQTRKREEEALREVETERGILGTIITPETYFNKAHNM